MSKEKKSGKPPVFDHTTAPRTESDRLNVRLMLRHDHCCEDPVGVESTYCQMLRTVEQPYYRRMSVGEAWQALDTKWLVELSCIVIENPAAPPRRVNPTPEEAALDAAGTIEYGYDGHPPFLVLPGTLAYFLPSQLSGLRIRCQAGTREVKITAMPG